MTLQVAMIFSNHMVLQRDTDISIWGTGEDKVQVSVEFCGELKSTETVGGQWFVKLSPKQAGGPFTMTISSGGDTIVLNDILIGEVWIAGGQSNMEWPLKRTEGGKEEIARALFDQIRFFDVPKIPYETAPLEYPHKYSHTAEWKRCSPDHSREFSAIAYHFARNIQETIDVPVGIIGCNLGGSPASCWMNEKFLSTDPDVKSYLDEYNGIISELEIDEYEERHKLVEAGFEKYNTLQIQVENGEISAEQMAQILSERMSNVEGTFTMPVGPKFMWRPMGLYHNMLKTIIPYSVKGVLFYQGESDTHKPRIYGKLFERLIQNWRNDWDNNQMPFLFVQLSAYGNEGNSNGDSYALLREQQSLVAEKVPYCGMVVSMDYGNELDIHPTVKKPIAYRLALLARAKVYGENVEYSGPVFKKMRIEGNKAILSFDYVGGGLTARGEYLSGFTICSGNKKFLEAKAEIVGDTVVVSHEALKGYQAPVAVRYAWANYAELSLYNMEGLPASPFRTDIYS